MRRPCKRPERENQTKKQEEENEKTNEGRILRFDKNVRGQKHHLQRAADASPRNVQEGGRLGAGLRGGVLTSPKLLSNIKGNAQKTVDESVSAYSPAYMEKYSMWRRYKTPAPGRAPLQSPRR